MSLSSPRRCAAGVAAGAAPPPKLRRRRSCGRCRAAVAAAAAHLHRRRRWPVAPLLDLRHHCHVAAGRRNLPLAFSSLSKPPPPLPCGYRATVRDRRIAVICCRSTLHRACRGNRRASVPLAPPISFTPALSHTCR
ncbi:hypothetical protein Syun_025121 [Stephania yunnanensis]|uniref:Uncharacterized protein n=1 Tax=Stephania yunnanensis TaxID=152371 RepID=A0AAP0ER32_9MAGN